jgi:hypothetical protein
MDSVGLGLGSITGSCEYDNETSGFTNGGVFLHSLSNDMVLKKNPFYENKCSEFLCGFHYMTLSSCKIKSVFSNHSSKKSISYTDFKTFITLILIYLEQIHTAMFLRFLCHKTKIQLSSLYTSCCVSLCGNITWLSTEQILNK